MWVPIKNYNGLYWINESGNIKNRLGKIKKTVHSKYCEYPSIVLEKNNKKSIFMVHRLVALHFIPNPKNKSQVNHKDKNKLNYHKDNLEWNTPKENMKHHYENGGVKRNNQTYKGKFGLEHNRSIRIVNNGITYDSITQASEKLNVPLSTIHYSLANNKKTRKGMHFQLSKI